MSKIEEEWNLHWLVWHNDAIKLRDALRAATEDKIEQKDPRGRTPLMLAVTLGHLESAKVLLEHNANVNIENDEGWSVVQEANATGDPELLMVVLESRNAQRFQTRSQGIPQLLRKLKEAPDFYVEMKWEFTTWVPLLSRICPSDTYKVYKEGSNVRIDTTLLGFEQNKWVRGNKSFIFKGRHDGAQLLEVDHDRREVYSVDLGIRELEGEMMPTQDAVEGRLSSPIVTTYVNTDKISFERNKSGIWGWRSDRCETINGHLCKVFSATNVELVTRTRMEHMTEDEKQRCREEEKDSLQLIAPLQTLLGILETSTVNEHEADENEKEEGMSRNAGHVTPEEYFDPGVDLGGRDIGRRKEMTTKIQKFKATLWLCDSYPLMLPEQILPIVDLMALSSAHFAKLRDFIQLQLPAGFPVKIEIPLFHVLNASITFGNIFGLDSPVEGVQYLNEEDTGRLSCVLSESCFQPPLGYTHTDTESAQMQPAFGLDEGDALMQYAIQQSLMEAGTENDMVNVWEALSGSNPGPVGDGHHLPAPSNRPLPAPPFNEEDTILQRAIAESLGLAFTPSESFLTSDDPDLEQAIRLSQEESEAWQHRQEEEEETLKRILELSLVEK